jgi:hypothetical protein
MLPAVTVTKNVFSTVGAPVSQVGILAIAACSSTGTVLQPGGYTRSDLAVTAFGNGPLPEYAAYNMQVANAPTTLIKGNATFAGRYITAVSTSGSGTALATAAVSGTPYDRYAVVIAITLGGTLGTGPISYTYSLDGGNTVSGVQSLGTAVTFTIPNTGVTFTFTTALTLVTGDTLTVYTDRPLMNDTDVTNVLNTLATNRLPWEGIYLDSSVSSSTVGLVDGILSGWEAKGIFKFAILNTPYKNEPEPGAETEAAYTTRLQTLVGNQTSIRLCLGADGAHVPSAITGYNLKRPTGMLLASKAMSFGNNFGIDPAYVAEGPIQGAQIADGNGNAFDHDEDLYPNLDGLRLVTCRSFSSAGPQGVYITNANTMQPTGGAFPYLQFVRIANQAATIAWAILTTQLSRGVRKNPKADPVTGAVYIFEPDASTIEALVNDAFVQPFKGQVSAIRFSLSRTDNLNATPVTVTGLISIVALAYIKGIAVQLQFNKTIQVAN